MSAEKQYSFKDVAVHNSNKTTWIVIHNVVNIEETTSNLINYFILEFGIHLFRAQTQLKQRIVK